MQCDPLGVRVLLHGGRGGVLAAWSHGGGGHGELGCVEDDLRDSLGGNGGDPHLTVERRCVEIRSQPQLVAMRMNRIGEAISRGYFRARR